MGKQCKHSATKQNNVRIHSKHSSHVDLDSETEIVGLGSVEQRKAIGR